MMRQVLQVIAEGTLTMEDMVKAMAAIMLGKTTITDLGGGLAQVKFRDTTDTVDRVVAGMANSNRTSVTITP